MTIKFKYHGKMCVLVIIDLNQSDSKNRPNQSFLRSGYLTHGHCVLVLKTGIQLVILYTMVKNGSF